MFCSLFSPPELSWITGHLSSGHDHDHYFPYISAHTGPVALSDFTALLLLTLSSLVNIRVLPVSGTSHKKMSLL